jgi:hypothetical protein
LWVLNAELFPPPTRAVNAKECRVDIQVGRTEGGIGYKPDMPFMQCNTVLDALTALKETQDKERSIRAAIHTGEVKCDLQPRKPNTRCVTYFGEKNRHGIRSPFERKRALQILEKWL